MTEKIHEVANELVRILSEESEEKARDYCRQEIESDVKPDTDEYEELKSNAIDETEVWGNESEKWMKLLPASGSEDETTSEWRFVTGNFFLSSVMECETNGSVMDDALIAKASHEMFEKLHKSDRHEKLSLALYHHKMGHVGILQEDYEAAVDNFQDALSIVDHHDSLGGWHHHCLILRDLAKAESQLNEEKGDLISASECLQDREEQIENTNAPTKEKFCKQIKAKEHRVRARMAAEIGNKKRQRKHLRKCSRLYAEGGKENLAEKYNRMEMQIEN